MHFGRLFIGGHRELRRPVNVVDESLMRRMAEARERLRREGKEVRPVRSAARASLDHPPRRTGSG